MILVLALAGGWLVGMASSRWRGLPYQPPELALVWLVYLAFLPPFAVLYLLNFQGVPNDSLYAACLIVSMLAFLGFAWLNRVVPGMSFLLLGLILNLAVITLNNGFMPISPHTASELISKQAFQDFQAGDRFGTKDILLLSESTRFEWLAGRFLPPSLFPYRFAFPLGDVFTALRPFVLLARPGLSIKKE